MGELVELIIRLIEALSGGDKKKKNTPSAADWQAQQAEWERQRREWEAAQQRQQAQPPPVIATPQQKGKKRGRSSDQAATPAEPAVRTLVADLAEAAQRVEVPRKATARPAASARTIAQWARPGTLRSQFILTEVLKPPLCVREPR